MLAISREKEHNAPPRGRDGYSHLTDTPTRKHASSILDLLRALLHRPCGVFDAFFDLVGRVPMAQFLAVLVHPCGLWPCTKPKLFAAPASACRNVAAQKGDGSVSSVSYTNVAAKTMPRCSPEEQQTGQGVSIRLGQTMLVYILACWANR
jgi:hypothetical protein